MIRSWVSQAVLFGMLVCGLTLAVQATADDAAPTPAPVTAPEPAPKPVDPPPEARTAPELADGGCSEAGCHADLKAKKHLHNPVKRDACVTCHKQEQTKHRFAPAEGNGKACRTCHDNMPAKKKVIHKPFTEDDCSACHDPHSSDRRKLLLGATDQELCSTAGCHKTDPVGDQQFVHGPVAAGECSYCHSGHQSDEPKLLSAPKQDICLDCHDIGVNKPNVHKPLEKGCSECHDAHASNHRFQLKKDPAELCFDCHKEIKDTVGTVKEKHGALEIKKRCQNCHEPHFSVQTKLLKKPEAQVCYSCHGTVVSGAGANRKELTDIKKLVAKAKPEGRHGAIREERCSPCHSPHGSNNFRILTAPYPKKFYAAFDLKNYELCFTCHSKDIVLDKTVTLPKKADEKKPNGGKSQGLTGFRNGEQNLHYLHVNREKGRTCRSCHETHASNHPKHIRDTVPFGRKNWPLPVNYEPRFTTDALTGKKEPSGGSCQPGCHRSYGYDRLAPVDNKKTP